MTGCKKWCDVVTQILIMMVYYANLSDSHSMVELKFIGAHRGKLSVTANRCQRRREHWTRYQEKMVSLWHVKANAGMVSMECCEDTRNTAMGQNCECV